MIEQLKTPSGRILVFGISQEVILVGILTLGNLRESIPLFLLLYFCAFSIFLGAVRYACHRSPSQSEGPDLLLLIVGFALLFRATLIFSAPSLSDDIYRYIWDGKLVVEGINPYSHVPGSIELSNLRDSQYDTINHKDIGTPYGPLTISVFAAVQLVSDSVLLMKVPFILFDCFSMILIVRMLSLNGLSTNNVVVYAWNPLVLMEVAGSGHNDSLGICMLLFALYCVQRKKSYAASFGMAFAFLSKYFSLLLLPIILKHISVQNRFLVVVIALLGYLPFATHMETHILNILTVGALWQFNDSLFSLLLIAVPSPTIAKALVIIIMTALAVLVWRSNWSPVKGSMIMIGSALLLTTTVQPWYLLWIAPFLCFSLNRAWLLLTGLVMLSYQVLIHYDATGIWSENLWIKLAIYVPFYSLLITDACRSLRTGLPRDLHT
jgi:hypothetical protein